MSVFKISSQVYLDKFNKCYKKIIVINEIPDDLKSHIRTVKKEKLSIFDYEDCCNETSKCIYSFVDQHKQLLKENQFEYLLNILATNNYSINYDLTNMMKQSNNNNNTNKNLLCYVFKSTA